MNFIKNNPLKILFFLSFLVLIISFLINIYIPEKIPNKAIVKTKIDTSEIATKTSYVFNYSKPRKPNELSVFSSPAFDINTKLLAEKLAINFKLSPLPQLENYWTSPDKKEFLRIRNDGIISYQETPTASQEPSPNIDPAKAKETASNFLKKTEIFNLEILKLSPPKMINITELGTTTVTNQEKAQFYQFSLDLMLDDIPFLFDAHNQPPALIYTTLNGEFFKAEFYPINTQFQEINSYETLSWETIEKNIKNNKGVLIEAGKQNPFSPPLSTDAIESISLDEVIFEYRQNKNSIYALPYAVFTGQGTTFRNNIYKIKIILPLIETAS